ncbi:MAG: hypothetical protein ACOCXF_02640 [bacterium]
MIATGAEPILPPIPGHDLDGVTVFKSQKDMERIAAMVEGGVRAAVVSYAEFTTAFPIMPTAKKVKLKLIADRQSGRILGGQVVSGQPVTDKVDQMTMAIQFGITARQLLGFSYSSQPWQSFYPAHNLLVKAAEGLVSKMNADRQVAARG